MTEEAPSRDWFWWIVGCGGALAAFLCSAAVIAAGWFYLSDGSSPGGGQPAIVVPTPPGSNVEATTPPLNLAPTATLAGAAASPAVVTPAPTVANLPRPGGSAAVFVARAPAPPRIDGRLDEWGSVAEIPLTARVFTRDTWDGTDDLEVTYRLLWDDQALYVGVTVVDDRHVQTFTGRTAFRGDSLEIQFDTDRAGDFAAQLSPDDYQWVLSPGDFAGLPPEAYRFRGTAAGRMDDFTGHGTTVAAEKTTTGYTLEARIPWSDLGLIPHTGLEIGAALNGNDNDQGGAAGQEIMLSNVSTRTFGDPTTWGILTLAP